MAHVRAVCGGLAFARHAAELPAAGDEPDVCWGRPTDFGACDRAADLHAHRGGARRGEAGVPVGGGSEVLEPSRGGSDGDRPGRVGGPDAVWAGTAADRRLHDHAAGGQEHAARQRGFGGAQGEGADPRGADRPVDAKGEGARAVFERDLPRAFELRRCGGSAGLFQQDAR